MLLPDQRLEIIAMCNESYDEDLEPLFLSFGPARHLLGMGDGGIGIPLEMSNSIAKTKGVSQLKTAYVEL